jgi:ABC-type dipeptide/oligopeptide/nickel transport system permease component
MLFSVIAPPIAIKEQYRERLGLNKPLPLQYLAYLGNFTALGFGEFNY